MEQQRDDAIKASSEELRFLLDSALTYIRQLENDIVFPDRKKLINVGQVSPPDQKSLFEQGVDIYDRLEKQSLDDDTLLEGAVCFYLSYKTPQEEIQKAILHLLKSAGAYTDACDYALSFIKADKVQALLCEDMPLVNRNNELNIHHLFMPVWKPEIILAAIIWQFKKHSEQERSAILRALVDEIQEIENSPQSVLMAVSAFLYASVREKNTFEQRQRLKKFISLNTCRHVVERLLSQYERAEKKYNVNRKIFTEWHKRNERFEQIYGNKIWQRSFTDTTKSVCRYLHPQDSVVDKWYPVSICTSDGNFVRYFIDHGLQMARREWEQIDKMDLENLKCIADEMMNVTDYFCNMKSKLIDCYLKAGAVLDKIQTSFGIPDMDEHRIESMIYAFWNLSLQETSSQNCNYDVQRSYLEQALHLSKRLNPQFLNIKLKNTIENMEKGYFKSRPGHDDGSLTEAVKYMAENISGEEFGNSLIRLAVYYPDILEKQEILVLCQSDKTIQNLLAAYVQKLEKELPGQEDIMYILRCFRDCVVNKFNTYSYTFDRTNLDNPEILKKELEKAHVWKKGMKYDTHIYAVLSNQDQKYMESFDSIIERMTSAVESRQFQSLRSCMNDCTTFLESLAEKPCSFAMEYIYERMDVLQAFVENFYKKLSERIQPVLMAEALFAEKRLERTDTINVYLRLSCEQGESPIQNLKGKVCPSEYVLEGKQQSLCPWIGNVDREYGFIEVRLEDFNEKVEQLEFTVEFFYTVEMTQEKKKDIRKLFVYLRNLKLEECYEQMYNPGSALDAANKMSQYTFCGRNKLIDRICKNFYDFPHTMVILYGQRRVGKTSIANHVVSKIQKDNKKILIVKGGNLSMQILKNSKTDSTKETICEFYATVLQKLIFAVESDHKRAICLQKEISEMKKVICRNQNMVTARVFREMIFGLQQAFMREDCWKETRILLWFDEFQQYYLYILKGLLKPEIMGFIKAFIEEYGFSLLLVGCEPMIPFIRDIRFGNTFSAAMQEYVSYLSEEHARNLICEPICKKSGRENPFQYIADEIYQLSAGSPFFIQLICKNLVDDLNDQKKVYANKQMIIDSLKNRNVLHDKFNCLYDSLDFRSEAATPEDNEKVLGQIAIRQGNRQSSRREVIIKELDGKTEKPVSAIITELISRKIIEETRGELRIVVRLYEAWIWENRFELGYQNV